MIEINNINKQGEIKSIELDDCTEYRYFFQHSSKHKPNHASHKRAKR